MESAVIADIIRPGALVTGRMFDVALVIGGAALIALLSQVVLPLPFTPVPITGQTLAVLLIGVTLGSRRGVMSVLAYIAMGLAGLPIFAGGAIGIARLAGPTGGYILGFIAAAYIVGLLAERGFDRKISTAIVAMVIGNAIIYFFGLAWLSLYVGIPNALSMGALPFIAGDAIKIAVASLLLPGAWKMVGR